MWGGGLLPIAECQSAWLYLTHRHREQVESSHRPSHIKLCGAYRGCTQPKA